MGNFFGDLGLKIILTIITTILSFTLWEFLSWRFRKWRHARMRRKALRYAEANENRVEMALCISVVNDITAAVRNHLQLVGLITQTREIPLLTVHQSQALSADESEWQALLDEVKVQIRKTRELGAMRVYVYASVPVAMALLIGAALNNGPEAVVFHYNKPDYAAVGRITFETIRI
jgi:hypothetical protein